MDNIDSLIAELIDEDAERARENFMAIVEWLGARCESPIETLFLAGFVRAANQGVRNLD